MPQPDATAESPRLATIPEAAQRFQISTRTLERMLATGQIPYLKVRGSIRLDLDEVRRHVRRPTGRFVERKGR